MSALATIETWGASHAAAAVVAADDRVERYGDTARAVPIASITKLATALAAMLAIEEGALDLDEPAGPPGATIRDLLCHTAGYAFDDPTILAPPRARRIYSNAGYEVLADTVAAAVAMPFGEYLVEGVFQPLGMGASALEGSAAAGMTADVEDVLRLAGEYRSPRLLHPSTVEQMRTVQFPELAGVLPGFGPQDPCPWGLGPELRGTKAPHWCGDTASAATYGHFGAAGGFVWTDPVAEITCVVLTDRPFGDWAVAEWPAFSDRVRADYR